MTHRSVFPLLARLLCACLGAIAITFASAAQRESASAIVAEGETISCPLREGNTTLIVSLPHGASRFTFINENLAASGELKIAVSNDKLPAQSTKWTPVEGSVHFNRKRLFDLSILGVDAKYVRLTFHVEPEGLIAAHPLHRPTARLTWI